MKLKKIKLIKGKWRYRTATEKLNGRADDLSLLTLNDRRVFKRPCLQLQIGCTWYEHPGQNARERGWRSFEVGPWSRAGEVLEAYPGCLLFFLSTMLTY
jgi:hypothetical protein